MQKILQPIHTAEELQAQAAEAQAVQNPSPAAPTAAAPVENTANPSPAMPTLPANPPAQPVAPFTAMSVPNSAAAASANSIYPDATHSVALPKSLSEDSQAASAAKLRLPVGIYIIAGLNLADVAFSFFRSNASTIFVMTLAVQLLVALGLLLRKEAARQVLIVLSLIVAIIAVADIVGLARTQMRYNQAMRAFNLSQAQTNEIKTINKELGHVILIGYIELGATVIICGGQAFYLTRLKIASAFGKLKTQL